MFCFVHNKSPLKKHYNPPGNEDDDQYPMPGPDHPGLLRHSLPQQHPRQNHSQVYVLFRYTSNLL